MENVIALAVLDKHSSCSETSERAFRRVRPVIPAVSIATVQGTTVPTSPFASVAAPAQPAGYGRPQPDGTTYGMTDSTTKDLPSGHPTWSPPV